MDLFESDMHYRAVEEMVNMHRKMCDGNKKTVGISAIRTCVLRLKPDVSSIGARCQGTNDPDAPWSKARFDQFMQYRIRLGRQRFSKLPVHLMLKPCFHNLNPHKFEVHMITVRA